MFGLKQEGPAAKKPWLAITFRRYLQRLLLVFFTLASATACTGNATLDDAALMDGDLVFQKSLSSQSEAIRQATGSPWTHVGVLWRVDGKWSVFEASGKRVRLSSLQDFVRASNGQSVMVRRAIDREKLFGPDGERKLRGALKEYMNRPYDTLFEWGDGSIYCSELVWKSYRDAFGVEVCDLERVGDLKHDAPAVKALIKRRFQIGEGGAAYSKLLDEKIVTPVSLAVSPRFQTIFP